MERWVDIGPLLQAARTDLKVGQLLHGEAFSLFEAMSALEVGNPKMDAAASPSVERPSLDTLLADPSVALWDLPYATLLAVLDQLLAMEASWQCGGSAMQTVYACLYMLKLDRSPALESAAARALHAYCRVLQCDCAAVRDLVMSGGVCEEEDINVFTAGIPFEPPVGAEAAGAALAALEAAIQELQQQPQQAGGDTSSSAAAAKAAGGGAAKQTGDAAGDAAGGDLSAAVAWRLRLRRALHRGLRVAASSDPQEVSSAGALFAEAQAALEQVRSSPSSPPQQQQPANEAPPEEGAAAATGGRADAAPPLAPGFQVDVNRHLLGPAPPRQVQIMPVAEALSYMERLVAHLQVVVAVPDHVHDYRSLQLYLWRFARMRPGAVARSLTHSLVMPERWQNRTAAAPSSGEAAPASQQQQPAAAAAAPSGAEGSGGKGKGGRKGASNKGGASSSAASRGPASGASTSAPTVPAWVPSKEMIAGACKVPYKAGLPEEAELFLEQAVIASANVFQAMLMNRCRCRRRLRRCLDDWLNMYHHGVNAELVPAFREHLRAGGWRVRPLVEGQVLPEDDQGPLSTWVEAQTAATMLHHLLLGFELELYEPLEYDMIFWYCDYLCNVMVGAYTASLQRAPPLQPPKPPPPQAAGAGGGRGLGRGLGRGRGMAGGRDPAAAAAAAAAAMARYEREQTQLRYEVVEVEAMQQLCQGMLRLMAGLRLAGSIPEHRSPLPFNGSPHRFEQRFASFSPLLRPPPLLHSDFLTSMDPGGRDAGQLFALAGLSFREARIRISALKTYAPHPDVAAGWVRGLERAAAMNAVVAGVLAHKLATEGGKLKWDCDWSQHPYFPAINLPKTAPAGKAAGAGGEAPAQATSSTSTGSSDKSTVTTSAVAATTP